jgi:hypothetical protein
VRGSASKRGDLFTLALVIPLAFVCGAALYGRARAPSAAASTPDEAAEQAASPGVAERLREVGPELDACYRRAVRDDPALAEGEILVRLEVAGSGEVRVVTIDPVAGGVANGALDGCIRAAAGRWTFPPAAEAYGVQFPVAFKR